MTNIRKVGNRDLLQLEVSAHAQLEGCYFVLCQ